MSPTGNGCAYIKKRSVQKERENPSLISLMVSVCVKHQVYLLTEDREGGKETDRQTETQRVRDRQRQTHRDRDRRMTARVAGRETNNDYRRQQSNDRHDDLVSNWTQEPCDRLANGRGGTHASEHEAASN